MGVSFNFLATVTILEHLIYPSALTLAKALGLNVAMVPPTSTAGVLSATRKSELLNKISALQKGRVLIVGDVGIDEYILGDVRRISPEAPVPILEVDREDVRLGLAANVAQNVVSLGGQPFVVSVVGQDSGADRLRSLCASQGVSAENFVVEADRPTTRKTRVMAKHHHLVRVDFEVRRYLSPATEAKVLERVHALLPQVQVVVLEDYAKGVLSQSLIQKITQLAKAQSKPVMVDPHREKTGDFYAGVDLIKPNYDEALALSGLSYDELKDHPNRVAEVGEALLAKTGAKQLVMTRGKDGMTIFSDGKITEVPTFARQVFDVTGAGDTVIAALALGSAGGLSLLDSCTLANFAAGVVVAQVGCVPCSTQELRDYIETF